MYIKLLNKNERKKQSAVLESRELGLDERTTFACYWPAVASLRRRRRRRCYCSRPLPNWFPIEAKANNGLTATWKKGEKQVERKKKHRQVVEKTKRK